MAQMSRQRMMNMTGSSSLSLLILSLISSGAVSPALLVAAFVPTTLTTRKGPSAAWIHRASTTTTTRRHWGDAETAAAATATATTSCRLFLEGSANPRSQYTGTCSKLFSATTSSSSDENDNNRRHRRRPFSLMQRFRQRQQSSSFDSGIRHKLQSMSSKVTRKFKRAILVLMMMAAFFCTSSRMTLPAHAESAASAVSIGTLQQPGLTATVAAVSSSTSSHNMDRMIDRYVKQHMFDDEPYDPVASLYREAHDDATVGAYPNALRQVTGSILGQQEGSKVVLKDAGGGAVGSDATGGGSFGNFFTSTVRFLQKHARFSEQTAIMILAGSFVIIGPTIFLFGGMVVGGISKRNMNKTMKKRYGDTYTVDATIKTEEEVEAPDDDEDDEEEEEEEEDDEEDDDEDDDDDDEKKNGKKKDGKKKK